MDSLDRNRTNALGARLSRRSALKTYVAPTLAVVAVAGSQSYGQSGLGAIIEEPKVEEPKLDKEVKSGGGQTGGGQTGGGQTGGDKTDKPKR